MTAISINKKQLTVDTSDISEGAYEGVYEGANEGANAIVDTRSIQHVQTTNQTPIRHPPTYCVKHDTLLKTIAIVVLTLMSGGNFILDWLFSPFWSSITAIRKTITFSYYAYVIVTMEWDDIMNRKCRISEKILFYEFVSNCDWVISIIEIAEGLIRCYGYFIICGELWSPYILYSSVCKIILYVYLLNV